MVGWWLVGVWLWLVLVGVGWRGLVLVGVGRCVLLVKFGWCFCSAEWVWLMLLDVGCFISLFVEKIGWFWLGSAGFGWFGWCRLALVVILCWVVCWCWLVWVGLGWCWFVLVLVGLGGARLGLGWC